MNDERDYIKNVGYRIVKDIQLVDSSKKADVLEGYYLRQSRYAFEEGYQKVRVRCVIDRRCDASWKVVENEN